jgi:ferredoxin
MAMVVTEPCFGCKYTNCLVNCPAECFHEGESILLINPDECIECWACVSECPVEAIYQEDDVPEKWHEYIELNREIASQCPQLTEKKTPLVSQDGS